MAQRRLDPSPSVIGPARGRPLVYRGLGRASSSVRSEVARASGVVSFLPGWIEIACVLRPRVSACNPRESFLAQSLDSLLRTPIVPSVARTSSFTLYRPFLPLFHCSARHACENHYETGSIQLVALPERGSSLALCPMNRVRVELVP